MYTNVSINGLNTASTVESLMQVERQPLNKLVAKQKQNQANLSSLGQIKLKLENLKQAAQNIKNSGNNQTTQINDSDKPYLNAAITGTPQNGTGNIEVIKSAKSTKLAMDLGTATSFSGDITLMTGGVSGNNPFQPNNTTTLTFNNASLQQIKESVANANPNLKASIITDVNGSKLILENKTTGTTAGDLQVQGTGNFTAPTQIISQAENAQVKINGVNAEYSSNSFEVEGVTLQINKSSEGKSINYTVKTEDNKQLQEKFVTAYNDLKQYIKNNPNATNRTLDMNLSQLLKTNTPEVKSLQQAGFSLDKNGVLSTTNTTTDPQKLKEFLNSLSNTTLNIGTKATSMVYSMEQSLNTKIAENAKQQDNQNRRLTQIEASLTARFDNLQKILSGLNQSGSALNSIHTTA